MQEQGEEDFDIYCDELPPDAWVGFGRSGFPHESWRFFKDGTLQAVEGAEAVDLMTVDEYGDFELELKWRVALGAESGILYRVSAGSAEAWQSGPEMQLVDDIGHADGRKAETSAGSLYRLLPPAGKVLRPAGTFNATRIVARGSHMEHWLNERKIVEYDTDSTAFADLVAKSAFKEYPAFGREARGHIVLQHHGTSVWFRAIRVRTLVEGAEI